MRVPKTQLILAYDYTSDTRDVIYQVIHRNPYKMCFARVPSSRGTNAVADTEVLVGVFEEGTSIIGFVDYLGVIPFPEPATVVLWVRFPYEPSFAQYYP